MKRSLRASKLPREKRTQLWPSSVLLKLSKTLLREGVTLYCPCPEPFWWKAAYLLRLRTEKLSDRSASAAVPHRRMELWPRPLWTRSRKCSVTNVRGARWKLSPALSKMTSGGEADLFFQSLNEIFPEEG